MSAEFEITNKTQKELQHTISIVASLFTTREMEAVTRGLSEDDATLLSSLIGITHKRVHEKIVAEAAAQFNLMYSSPTRKTVSGKIRSDQDRMEWEVPDEYHSTPSSLESCRNRKFTPMIIGRYQAQDVEQRHNTVINLKSIEANRKRIPAISSDIEILRIGSEPRKEIQKSAVPVTDDPKKRSRSKERYPQPVSISKDVLHSHRGDLDEPNS
jgi:hypothetical protein